MKKIAKKTAKVSILIYLGVLLLLGGAQRQLIYWPQHEVGPPAQYDLPEIEEIKITTADGLTLRSWYIPPQAGKPVLVQFTGQAGSLLHMVWAARRLAQEGYGQLLVGYRGYNGDPGSPSEQGFYADARANLKWLGERPFVLWGVSLGTGVAVQMATEFVAKGLILESPFTSVADVAQQRFWFLPAYWMVVDRFDSFKKIGAIRAPLLLIHSADDTIVPYAFGQKLFAAAPEPKQALWLDGVNHAPWRSELTEPTIKQWLKELD